MYCVCAWCKSAAVLCRVLVEIRKGHQIPKTSYKWLWAVVCAGAGNWSCSSGGAARSLHRHAVPSSLHRGSHWFSLSLFGNWIGTFKIVSDYLCSPDFHKITAQKLCAEVWGFSTAVCRPLSQRSSEMEYINKYRQLEEQELDIYGQDQPPSGPGKQVSLNTLYMMHG